MPSSEKKKAKNGKNSGKTWIVKIVIITFIISVMLSVLSSSVLENVNIGIAVIFLLLFIIVNIIFDIVGTSVTAATETQFHSMAAKKVDAATEAISLIRRADVVSNFCNDVIGDICGIISGTTGAVIVTFISKTGFNAVLAGIIVTAITASLIVGGKAFGKSLAVSHSEKIVYLVAKIITFFKSLFKRKRED